MLAKAVRSVRKAQNVRSLNIRVTNKGTLGAKMATRAKTYRGGDCPSKSSWSSGGSSSRRKLWLSDT